MTTSDRRQPIRDVGVGIAIGLGVVLGDQDADHVSSLSLDSGPEL